LEGWAVSLTFICPSTGGILHSGIRTDRQTLTVARNIRLYVRCERCGDEHRFSVKDARAEAA
jgi:RNase P subunit RPR2